MLSQMKIHETADLLDKRLQIVYGLKEDTKDFNDAMIKCAEYILECYKIKEVTHD